MTYKTFDNDKARLLLGNLNAKNLIVFGVNPSYATDKISDRTITKVKKFAEQNKFNGWLMLNIYPQRATDPNCLHENYSHEYHRENLTSIRNIFSEINSSTIWCAWGNTIMIRAFLI